MNIGTILRAELDFPGYCQTHHYQPGALIASVSIRRVGRDQVYKDLALLHMRQIAEYLSPTLAALRQNIGYQGDVILCELTQTRNFEWPDSKIDFQFSN